MHRLTLLTVGFYALICVLLVVLVREESAGDWKNYHMVLFQGDISLFHEKIEQGGGRPLEASEILSAHTAEVELQTFSQMHTFPVEEISYRLDTQDIRYDSYLQKISSLFQAENGTHIIYISKDIGKLRLWWELTRRLQGMSWYMVGGSPFFFLVVGVSIIAISVLLMHRFPHLWMMILFQAGTLCVLGIYLPLLPILPLLLMGIAGVHICDRLCTGVRAVRAEGALRYLYQWTACGILIWAVSLLVMRLLNPRFLIFGTMVALQQLGITAIVVYHQYLKTQAMEHPLFTPAQFISRTSFSLKPGVMAWIPVVVYFSFMVFSLLLPNSPDNQMIPSVAKSTQNSISQSYFPTRDQYLAHRAFQLTLPFGGTYQVPVPGERVEVSYFLPAGIQTVKNHQTVIEWTDEWIQEQLRPSVRYHAANILLYQKKDTHVVSSLSMIVGVRPVTIFVFTILTLLVFGFSCFPLQSPRSRGFFRQWVPFSGILRVYGKQ